MTFRRVASALAGGLALGPEAAFAHASERGHVLLLPTGYYLVGGALAVAATFVVLIFVKPALLARYAAARLDLCPAPSRGKRPIGFLAFGFVAAIIAAGFLGSADPTHNPLPATFWTLIWVGLTLAQGMFGNIWSWLNPWHWPYHLVRKGSLDDRPLATLPPWLGMWPAVALLTGFIWFELIYIAPTDPRRLARVLGLYWLFTFAGCLVFGFRSWMSRCEFLTVYFDIVSRFSIVEADARLKLCFPGARLDKVVPLAPSGVAFVLTALGAVSFDGLYKTFAGLGRIGVNPLDYPGRSAVMAANTSGLFLTILTLGALFVAAVWLGARLIGATATTRAFGTLIWSIVPISLAYHFAHYLTTLLVDGQVALIALSDPLSRGWNLLGLTGAAARAGLVMGHDAAWKIWNAQAAAIVGGHVIAVLVAHMLALRLYVDPRNAAISQAPLTVLMIGYTLLGLWLLSAPSI